MDKANEVPPKWASTAERLARQCRDVLELYGTELRSDVRATLEEAEKMLRRSSQRPLPPYPGDLPPDAVVPKGFRSRPSGEPLDNFGVAT